MEGRKTFWFLLIILILGCNVLILINQNKKNSQISIFKANWQKSEQRNTTLIDYFLEREKKCIESENINLFGQLIIKDLYDNEYFLKDKLDQSPKLFFRFSASNCQTCIDIEMQRLVRHLAKVDPLKVIVLASDKNIKDLNYLKKVNNINFQIFIVKKEQVFIPLEKYNIPYLFLLTANRVTSSVFIPERNESRFSEQYYSIIEDILKVE